MVGSLTKKPYTFCAEGRPRAKGRPRMTKSGRTYTPKSTLDAQERIAEQYDGPLYEGPVHVIVEYNKDDQLVKVVPLDDKYTSSSAADIDNLLKLTLDALNGVAWNDDRQVVRLTAEKLH